MISLCLVEISDVFLALFSDFKESGTPMLPLGTERGLTIKDGSADVSPFV